MTINYFRQINHLLNSPLYLTFNTIIHLKFLINLYKRQYKKFDMFNLGKIYETLNSMVYNNINCYSYIIINYNYYEPHIIKIKLICEII